MNYNMNNDWYFTENYTKELLHMTTETMKELTPVRLPHTVKEMETNYCDEQEYQMVSGYVRMLHVPLEWKGKCIYLHFGAAAHEAEVFCNGVLVTKHSSGYTAFTADLTKSVLLGKDNLITVRLDSRETLNIPPFGHVIDYMTFGGLYRGVTLEVKEPSHFADVFVYGTMDKVMYLEMKTRRSEKCTVSVEVKDASGTVLAETPARPYIDDMSMEVPGAALWDINNPNLYTVILHLWKDRVEVDTRQVRFGFREVAFTSKGFYLNRKKIKLRGLNRHQSYPYMGYAAPDRAQALDADILKYELGCNAVRTSHYPQSQAFVDRCDEIGLLVFTEFPRWQHIGDKDWKKQAVQNVREMVLQYRNHPSIFLWGVRINESKDDDALYRMTNVVAHKLDHTRPTGGVRNRKNSHLLEDVYTYNDFYHNGPNKGCEPKKNITSNMRKGYLISENNGHMFPTKSFDWEEKRCEHALRHAAVLDEVRAQADIAGSFGWCMFDYNTHQDFGSGDRVCYHGVMDMFRNPKMAAAVFAAEGLKTPVLEISSSMDMGEHPACNMGDVYAFTNADYVKLYKNDEFIAKFAPGEKFSHMKHGPILLDDTIGCLLEKNEGYDKKTAAQVKECLYAIAKYGQAALPPRIRLLVGKLMLTKQFTFEKGNELCGKYMGNWGGKMTQWKFVAVKNGKPVAEVKKGPAEQPRLEVRTDTNTLTEGDTWDMATIRIRAVDDNHNVLPYSNRAISMRVDGPLALIGPEHVALTGGAAGTYVKTTGETGTGHLMLRAPGMEPVVLTFEVTGKNMDE
ncbi:MAG: glycoside hydrolase family 2 TIM barrel-domain containing protein [Lachnospiraceae bacterium]|nr:glycoside hydrolase family 2 TIM barrel-domain containing protein [Lachnospiraceae bacterium]